MKFIAYTAFSLLASSFAVDTVRADNLALERGVYAHASKSCETADDTYDYFHELQYDGVNFNSSTRVQKIEAVASAGTVARAGQFSGPDLRRIQEPVVFRV